MFSQTLGALLVLTLPELVLAAEDETLMIGEDLQARARRFLEREMRARLFLSIMMAVFAIRGFKSVQSVDVQGRQALCANVQRACVTDCIACVRASVASVRGVLGGPGSIIGGSRPPGWKREPGLGEALQGGSERERRNPKPKNTDRGAGAGVAHLHFFAALVAARAWCR